MQLCDVLKDTDAIQGACDEADFQKHLKELSELPKWKRKQLGDEMQAREKKEAIQEKSVHIEEIEKWEEELDRKIEEKLNKQMEKSLAYIQRAEKRIIGLGRYDEWILWKIDDMKRYVRKHKWLPPSYVAMLKEWQSVWASMQ